MAKMCIRDRIHAPLQEATAAGIDLKFVFDIVMIDLPFIQVHAVVPLLFDEDVAFCGAFDLGQGQLFRSRCV